MEDVLQVWREAERLLEGSPDRIDRERLERTIGRLRTLYAELSSTSDVAARKLAHATAVVQRSRRVLEEANERLRRAD
jgi:hypothetical protein